MTEQTQERCDACAQPYAGIWYAENALWNRVVGSPNGFLCPNCFAKQADAQGIVIYFAATSEHARLEQQDGGEWRIAETLTRIGWSVTNDRDYFMTTDQESAETAQRCLNSLTARLKAAEQERDKIKEAFRQLGPDAYRQRADTPEGGYTADAEA